MNNMVHARSLWFRLLSAGSLLSVAACSGPSDVLRDEDGSFACSKREASLPLSSHLRPEVLGGSPAGRHELPALARLTLDGEQHCGAVVLSLDWLLTAAHCVERAEGRHLAAVLGDYDITENEAGEQAFEIVDQRVHPRYDTLGGLITDHDLALVRLDHAAAATEFVQPIALGACGPPEQVVLAGWGSTGNDSLEARVPNVASVPVASADACGEHLSRLDASEQAGDLLCVGGATGTPGGCHRDSGGPALVSSPSGELKLAGVIVAGGPACDELTLIESAASFGDWVRDSLFI